LPDLLRNGRGRQSGQDECGKDCGRFHGRVPPKVKRPMNSTVSLVALRVMRRDGGIYLTDSAEVSVKVTARLVGDSVNA
jgi:hypothetical protein